MTKRDPTLIEAIKCCEDFVSDGCSMSPDLVFSECCVYHDIYYSVPVISRQHADTLLRKCIRDKGFPVLSWVYWVGVRLFGWLPYYFGRSYNRRLEYNSADHAEETD